MDKSTRKTESYRWFSFALHIIGLHCSLTLKPLKASGNYMYQLLWQSLTLKRKHDRVISGLSVLFFWVVYNALWACRNTLHDVPIHSMKLHILKCQPVIRRGPGNRVVVCNLTWTCCYEEIKVDYDKLLSWESPRVVSPGCPCHLGSHNQASQTPDIPPTKRSLTAANQNVKIWRTPRIVKLCVHVTC